MRIRFLANVTGMTVRITQLPDLLTIFDLYSIGMRRRAMANGFCVQMKELCKDELEVEQQARMQALKTLRDLKISQPCRKLIGSIIRPPAVEAIDAMRKRTKLVNSCWTR